MLLSLGTEYRNQGSLRAHDVVAQREKPESSHMVLVTTPTGGLLAPELEKAIIRGSSKECWNCPRAQRSSNSGTAQAGALSETLAASGMWDGGFLYHPQQ